MKPRSLNILLLGGDPDGVKVAQIAISNIQAIAFRRNQLRRVRDTGEALLPAPSGHEFTASALVRQMYPLSGPHLAPELIDRALCAVDVSWRRMWWMML